MFVTIVEGEVEAARVSDLLSAWKDKTAVVLPAGLIESFLLRAEDGPWRICSVTSVYAFGRFLRATAVWMNWRATWVASGVSLTVAGTAERSSAQCDLSRKPCGLAGPQPKQVDSASSRSWKAIGTA